MIVTAIDCWKDSKDLHTKYFDKFVKAKYTQHKKTLPPSVFTFIKKNHKNIRDGKIADFRRIQQEFATILGTLSPTIQAQVDANVKDIYCYNTFAADRKNRWCAYKLCQKSTLLTCPYCNLSYGHTLILEKGEIRPTLDHFFDKARYPLFAISLGNLVPSCYQCNCSLKTSTDFYVSPHLNPLEEYEQVQVTLDIDPVMATYDIKLFDSANIKIVPAKRTPAVTNSVKTFLLRERYQFVVDEARFIALNLQIYKNMKPLLPGSQEWILRGTNASNYRNRIMGKMIFDLFSKYG